MKSLICTLKYFKSLQCVNNHVILNTILWHLHKSLLFESSAVITCHYFIPYFKCDWYSISVDIKTIMICAACVHMVLADVECAFSCSLMNLSISCSARCYSFTRQAVIDSDWSQSDSFVVCDCGLVVLTHLYIVLVTVVSVWCHFAAVKAPISASLKHFWVPGFGPRGCRKLSDRALVVK